MLRMIRLLHLLPPETAHTIGGAFLNSVAPLLRMRRNKPKKHPWQLADIAISNRVGIAAGFDKNGDYLHALAACGFGFIEVGTVTPKPQLGNPKPRLFRYPHHQAIINRMGFNNHGVRYTANKVAAFKQQNPDCCIGVNIGKNTTTDIADAAKDYIECYQQLRNIADYTTLNISSPNTPKLRELQQQQHLIKLLEPVFAIQSQHSGAPVCIKIAPDLDDAAVAQIVTVLNQFPLAALIVANTTIDHSAVIPTTAPQVAGGLSGPPVHNKALHAIAQLRAHGCTQPIIGVGGISKANDMQDFITASASAVQLYTGFVYRGLALVDELLRADAI